MPKQKNKTNPKPPSDTIQELILMRMSIKAIRDRMNEDLDAMADQINRLLPPEDDSRHQRYKNFTSKDWSDFLHGRIS